MPDFFPRHSIAWKVEEPAAFRALTLSVLEIGLLTGVVLRLVRALALAYGPAGSLAFLVTLEIVLALARFGAAAAHLGNYPVRHWAWRTPLFALVVVAAQMATSLLLIAAHRERIGSARADWDDWPSMAWRALVWQTVSLCIFALLLAAVVQYVRSALLRHERRASTVEAVHEGRTG
jgi:hypothetical protein